MTSHLILNADDFGLTEGINRAVAELFRAGVLTSATLMANGPAFAHAVTLARSLPGLGVGCHVVLTDGVPLSDPASIPSLLGSDGRSFRTSLAQFAAAALLNRLSEAEIEREAAAQVARLLEAGIHPTHLDTHKHTHMLPQVLRPLLRVAEAFRIPAIRNPFEPPWSLRRGQSRALRRTQVRLLRLLEPGFHRQPLLRSGRVRTTNGAIGVAATGDLDRAALQSLLRTLPVGTWELVCHPGYSDQDLDRITTRLRSARDVEREALLQGIPGLFHVTVAPDLQGSKNDRGTAELISFAALRPEPAQASPQQDRAFAPAHVTRSADSGGAA